MIYHSFVERGKLESQYFFNSYEILFGNSLSLSRSLSLHCLKKLKHSLSFLCRIILSLISRYWLLFFYFPLFNNKMFSFVLDKFHLSLINIYLCFHLSISCENLVARSNCFLTTFIIDLYNFRSSTEKLLLMLFLPSLPAAWPRAFLWWKTKESRLKWELDVAKERFYDDIYLNKFLP